MAKIQIDPKVGSIPDRAAVPPLNSGIRRHLGQNLRSHYAATLSDPVSERLEALLAKLGALKN